MGFVDDYKSDDCILKRKINDILGVSDKNLFGRIINMLETDEDGIKKVKERLCHYFGLAQHAFYVGIGGLLFGSTFVIEESFKALKGLLDIVDGLLGGLIFRGYKEEILGWINPHIVLGLLGVWTVSLLSLLSILLGRNMGKWITSK